MRKIDKELSLAIVYKAWLDDINARGETHPKYNSSKGEYYNDIVANLLWVQQGLCAYTEMYLIDPARVNPALWVSGKMTKVDFFGQLEHYNSVLKTDRCWEWTNFFVAHSDVNTKRKGTKKVNSILKPDLDDYSPFDFLEYDFKTHFFKPAVAQPMAMKQLIMEDMFALGLNFPPVVDHRKKQLTPLIDAVQLGQMTLKEARAGLHQFYTAFEMIVMSLGLT